MVTDFIGYIVSINMSLITPNSFTFSKIYYKRRWSFTESNLDNIHHGHEVS
jgi:hypothetical protein